MFVLDSYHTGRLTYIMWGCHTMTCWCGRLWARVGGMNYLLDSTIPHTGSRELYVRWYFGRQRVVLTTNMVYHTAQYCFWHSAHHEYCHQNPPRIWVGLTGYGYGVDSWVKTKTTRYILSSNQPSCIRTVSTATTPTDAARSMYLNMFMINPVTVDILPLTPVIHSIISGSAPLQASIPPPDV